MTCAAGLWLSIGGFHEKGPDEAHVYNAHVILDETGHLRSVYRKIHLFSYRPKDPNESVLTESNSTAPGTEVSRQPQHSAEPMLPLADSTALHRLVKVCDNAGGRL